jgi:hypothetical protein
MVNCTGCIACSIAPRLQIDPSKAVSALRNSTGPKQIQVGTFVHVYAFCVERSVLPTSINYCILLPFVSAAGRDPKSFEILHWFRCFRLDTQSDYFVMEDVGKKAKSGSFQALGLEREFLNALNRMGYKTPTPIQRKALPLALAGIDLVCMARTGSGKTCAFLLPIVQKLKAHSSTAGVRGVVLSPTRELAVQTYKFAKDFDPVDDLPLFVGLKPLSEPTEERPPGLNPPLEPIEFRSPIINFTSYSQSSWALLRSNCPPCGTPMEHTADRFITMFEIIKPEHRKCTYSALAWVRTASRQDTLAFVASAKNVCETPIDAVWAVLHKPIVM